MTKSPFVPKARKVADGFVAMVMVRGAKGRLYGSAASRHVYANKADAFAHAIASANRAWQSLQLRSV